MALRHVLLLVAAVLCAADIPARAAALRPVPTRGADPAQDIVSIATPDGLQLAGVFTLPPGGAAPGAPIVLLLPDGPGGTPIKATDPARFLAKSLAREGYGVLTLETRQTTQYPFTHFDDAFAEVKAALDLAAARGFGSAIVGGAGLGSLLAARYAAFGDDARVRALLAYGPSVDLPAALRMKLGEETYNQTVARATKAAADNVTNSFIDLGAGVIFTPAAFLDWYGPAAKTSFSATLAAVDRPTLLVAGTEDTTAAAPHLQQLAQILPSRKATIKTFAAGHDLSRARDAVAAATVAWLAENGLAPPPKVTTTIVDVTTADGVALSGVLYTTNGNTGAGRPMFLLVPGLSGDAMRGLTHILGLRLAQHGYTALVVRTRGSGYRNTLSGKLEDVPKDLAAWSEFLSQRGASRIIGVGHAIGGLWLSAYLSKTQDKRYRGAVYLSPPRDLPDLARRAMGDAAYDRAVTDAETAVRAGKGASTLITVPFPQPAYEEDAREPMFLSSNSAGYLNAYADAFLSYWGPKALSVNSARVHEMKVPVFAIGGSRDYMMQGAWLLHFIDDAGGPATAVFYGGPNGASGSFDGFEGKIVDDVLGWAQRLP